jgi:hypothetical protein
MSAVSPPAKAKHLVKVGSPPPSPKRIDSPPQGTPSPVVHTLPMAFEPISPPTPAIHTAPQALTPASLSALAVAVHESPGDPLAPGTPPVGLSLDLPPLPRPLLSPRLFAVAGGVMGALLLVVGAASLWRRHPAEARDPVVAVSSVAPVTLDSRAATAIPTAATTTPDLPAAAPPVTADEPVAPASAEVPIPVRPFAAFAARQALDATSRNVLGCRRGKLWGVA